MSIDELAWGAGGLLPVVVQDAVTGDVLTLAYANLEALRRTLAERTTWLYSRSRAALWKKGETSGNTQAVLDVRYDCDADALLYRVRPSGPACHTGAASCFSASLPMTASTDSIPLVPPPSVPVPFVPVPFVPVPFVPVPSVPAPLGSATFERAIEHLRAAIVARRGASPESSYTAKLLHQGIDRIAKKIGEEATEVVIAAKNEDAQEVVWEVADLFYHTLVLLEARGIALDAVGAELLRRAR